MNTSALIVIVYAVLVAVGGVIGFVKAGSPWSLVSAVGSAVLLAFAALGITRGAAWGVPLALAVAAVLLVFFGVRYSHSHAFMPGGLMIILSLLTLIGVSVMRGR